MQMWFWSSEHNAARVLGCKNIAMEKSNKNQETSLKPSNSYFHLIGNKRNYFANSQFSVLDRNQAIEAIFVSRKRKREGRQVCSKPSVQLLELKIFLFC